MTYQPPSTDRLAEQLHAELTRGWRYRVYGWRGGRALTVDDCRLMVARFRDHHANRVTAALAPCQAMPAGARRDKVSKVVLTDETRHTASRLQREPGLDPITMWLLVAAAKWLIKRLIQRILNG